MRSVLGYLGTKFVSRHKLAAVVNPKVTRHGAAQVRVQPRRIQFGVQAHAIDTLCYFFEFNLLDIVEAGQTKGCVFCLVCDRGGSIDLLQA